MPESLPGPRQILILVQETQSTAMLETQSHRLSHFGRQGSAPGSHSKSIHSRKEPHFAVEARRRPDATSEPSCSARTSLDDAVQPSIKNSASNNDGTCDASSPTKMAHSPFQSFAHLPHDDSDIGRSAHREGCGCHVDERGNIMGLDDNATSAPAGALDEINKIEGSTPSNLQINTSASISIHERYGRNRPPSKMHTLASLQGLPLDPQGIVHLGSVPSTPAALCSLCTDSGVTADEPSLLSSRYENPTQKLQRGKAGRGTVSDELVDELANELEEAYGAHLVPPVQKGPDLTVVVDEPSVLTGLSQNSARSSLDLLLATPASSGRGQSRHSLDSLQELLAPFELDHSGIAASLSKKPGPSPSAAQRLRAGIIPSASALRVALESLSLAPEAAGKKVASPRSAMALRTLADTSVTVVAQPKRVAGPAGPSVGAMASALVDHYSPGSTESPPARSAGAGTSVPSGLSPVVPAPAPLAASALDADLHDTFGAHAWYAGGTAASTTTQTVPMAVRCSRQAPSHLGMSHAGGPGSADGHAVLLTDATDGGSAGSSVDHGTKMFEPTAVPGQHSVTLHDSQSMVPSFAYLRRRQLVKQLDEREYTSGGYIAEAKRVLNEAMSGASKTELEVRDSSYSGAIGPLLRHLESARGDDQRSRSALHTLSLLVSNLPNRGIICQLQGRRTLASTLRTAHALDVREAAVQLLWDLDAAAGKDAAEILVSDDLRAFLDLLRETHNAAVASDVLHFLNAAVERSVFEPWLTMDLRAELASRVVQEVCAHAHHLQDSAQYTLGALLGNILDPSSSVTGKTEDATLRPQLLGEDQVAKMMSSLLRGLGSCGEDPLQCQLLLTVLSSLAGRPRLRAVLERQQARVAVLQLAQGASDMRIQARALSLVKVLSRDESGRGSDAVGAGWYFGLD